MVLMNEDSLRNRKIEQIFATFDANHDGGLSKVSTGDRGRYLTTLTVQRQ